MAFPSSIKFIFLLLCITLVNAWPYEHKGEQLIARKDGKDDDHSTYTTLTITETASLSVCEMATVTVTIVTMTNTTVAFPTSIEDRNKTTINDDDSITSTDDDDSTDIDTATKKIEDRITTMTTTTGKHPTRMLKPRKHGSDDNLATATTTDIDGTTDIDAAPTTKDIDTTTVDDDITTTTILPASSATCTISPTVTNGDFGYGAGTPTGWSLSTATGYAAVVELSTTEAPAEVGRYKLVQTVPESDAPVSIYQTVPACPGKTYSAQVYGKSASNQGSSCELVVCLDESCGPVQDLDDNEYLPAAIVAPATASSMLLTIYTTCKGGNVVYLDTVTLAYA